MAFPIAYTPSGGPIAAAANPGFSQLVAAGLVDVNGNVLSVDSNNILQFVAGTGNSGVCQTALSTVSSTTTLSVFWNGLTYTVYSRIVSNTHYYCLFTATNIQFWYGTNQGTQIGANFAVSLTSPQNLTLTFGTNQINSTTTLLSASIANSSGVIIAAAQITDKTSGGQNVSGPCGFQIFNPDGTHGVYSVNITNAGPVNPTVLSFTAPPSSAIQLVLDTDISTDSDDVGDVGLCCAMHRGGLINLNGIIATNKNAYGASCVKALLNYGLPGNNILVGQYNGSNTLPNATSSPYDQQITQAYGPAGDVASNYPGHITVYRTIFAAAAPKSIVLVVSGSITSFVEFFNSGADGISPLTGIQLAQQKLKSVNWEACFFQSCAVTNNNTAEYNVTIDTAGALSFSSLMLTYCPTVDVFWAGDEITNGLSLVTRFPLSHGAYSPFNMAIQLHLNSASGTYRPCWGQTALNYAVYGNRLFAPLGYRGTNTFDSGGRNSWVATPGQDSYLTAVAPNGTIITSMNQDLLMAAPVNTSELVALGTGTVATPYINGAGTAYPKTIPIGRVTSSSAFANVPWVIPASGVPGATGTAQSGQTTFSISPQGAAEFGELLDRMVSDGRATIS